MIALPADRIRREGDCLLWTGPVFPCGSAQIRNPHGSNHGHRAVYEAAYGPVPYGCCVFHTCSRIACLAPEHLWAGTLSDRAAWGRMADPRLVPPKVIRRQREVTNYAA